MRNELRRIGELKSRLHQQDFAPEGRRKTVRRCCITCGDCLCSDDYTLQKQT